MAKQYCVLERSFINNTVVEEGEIVEYDGKPGKNLELIEGRRKAQKADKTAEGAGEGDPLV